MNLDEMAGEFSVDNPPLPRRRNLATMEDEMKICKLEDATGFIRLNGLRLKVAAKVHGKKK